MKSGTAQSLRYTVAVAYNRDLGAELLLSWFRGEGALEVKAFSFGIQLDGKTCSIYVFVDCCYYMSKYKKNCKQFI